MNNLIAHRGLKKVYKENTIEAFKSALDNDYAGFECDIRQTLDKKYVICHDPIYKGKLIRNTDYKNLNNLITLEDVLNISTNKMILIDIKDPLIDIELFNSYIEKKDNIYVISFHNSIIKRLDKINKKYHVGLLNYILNSNNNEKDYDFICLLNDFVTEDLIKVYEKLNKKIFIYGITKKIDYLKYPYYIVD